MTTLDEAPRRPPLCRALPAAVGSRAARPVLSTSARLDRPRALELAGLVGAAVGAVALLSALCR